MFLSEPEVQVMNCTTRFIALSLAALSAGLFLRAESNNKIPLPSPPVQVGQVNFSTSCSAEARPEIETGVALFHSFQYLQADHSIHATPKTHSHLPSHSPSTTLPPTAT